MLNRNATIAFQPRQVLVMTVPKKLPERLQVECPTLSDRRRYSTTFAQPVSVNLAPLWSFWMSLKSFVSPAKVSTIC